MAFLRLRAGLLSFLTLLLITADMQPQIINNPDRNFFKSWIYESYYNEIINTRSIYRTYKNNGYHFIGFVKEKKEVLITTQTEGQTFKYLAESKNRIKVFNLDTGEFICSMSLINYKNKTKLILTQGKDTTVFVPLNKRYNSPDLYLNNQMFVNDLLFSGNYKDVTGNKSFIFNSDGSLYGFDKYNYYLIPLSGSGVPFNFDTILLQEREVLPNNKFGTIKSNLILHWTNSNGNLIFYKLSENTPDGVIAGKYLELKKMN